MNMLTIQVIKSNPIINWGAANILAIMMVVVALIIIFTYLYAKKHGTKKTIKDYRLIAYQLMLTAEKSKIGGEVKRLFVTHTLYSILPIKLRALFTIGELEEWVQGIYDHYVMDYLDDGVLNNSYEP